jgi:alpha-ribazole phosphatase
VRLLLVRHGIAEAQDGRVIGHSDPPLSDRGRADMAALIATGLERPARLVCSDLRRARESAEILARHWGLEPITDTRLRELNFGQWEGRTWRELEQQDTERLGRWMADWVRTPPPDGESFVDLVVRTSAWLEEWDRQGWSGESATVVVAHAGSIRAILCRLLRVPLEEAFGFEVGYARVTALDLAGAAPRLLVRDGAATPPDPTCCPLCGADNACGVAAGKSATACWCHGVRVSQATLDRIPETSRDQVCVCARCAERG